MLTEPPSTDEKISKCGIDILGVKGEGSSSTGCARHDPGGHYAKSKNSQVPSGQMCDSTWVMCLSESDPERQKMEPGLPGAGGREMGEFML